jgi:hypothetical protein
MAIIRVPIPDAWIDGRNFVIEFDSDNLSGVEMIRDLADVGEGRKEFTGDNRVTFKFNNFADAPRWVEV